MSPPTLFHSSPVRGRLLALQHILLHCLPSVSVVHHRKHIETFEEGNFEDGVETLFVELGDLPLDYDIYFLFFVCWVELELIHYELEFLVHKVLIHVIFNHTLQVRVPILQKRLWIVIQDLSIERHHNEKVAFLIFFL